MDTMRRIVASIASDQVVSTGKKGRFQWSEMDTRRSASWTTSRGRGIVESKLRDAIGSAPPHPSTSTSLCGTSPSSLSVMVPRGTLLPAPGRKPRVCVRVSHAIGGGISLVSILNTCGQRRQEAGLQAPREAQLLPLRVRLQPHEDLILLRLGVQLHLRRHHRRGHPSDLRDSKTALRHEQEGGLLRAVMVNCPGFALSDLKEVKTKMDVRMTWCARASRGRCTNTRNTARSRRRRSSLVSPPSPSVRRAPALYNDWTFVWCRSSWVRCLSSIDSRRRSGDAI